MRTIFTMLLSVLLLSACASGPKFADIPAEETALLPGQAQIAVYRDNTFGFALAPAVSVDRMEAGVCKALGVFLVDVKPGAHELAATTEVRRTLMVNAQKNRRSYVKCSIGFGWLAGRPKFEEVPEDVGARELQGMSYMGRTRVPADLQAK